MITFSAMKVCYLVYLGIDSEDFEGFSSIFNEKRMSKIRSLMLLLAIPFMDCSGFSIILQ